MATSDKAVRVVRLAERDEEVARCFPVMVQLRPHLTEDTFVAQVARQRQEGYQLAYVEERGAVRALAGFRVQEMLFRGRHIYVDDLITDATERSKGHGDLLFDWLVEHARTLGCNGLDLDSGVRRGAAHRFYFRKRMIISSYHFTLKLEE